MKLRAAIPMRLASTNRREFVATAAAVSAAAFPDFRPLTTQVRTATIKAVAFGAFSIFDPRSVFRVAEDLFPDRGAELSSQWRTRQFEYTWLRNCMRQYTNFWRVTEDALNYAAKQIGVEVNAEQRVQLMNGYLQLKPWPDVVASMEKLRRRGLRLALLSNMTPAMMDGCVKRSGLEGVFEFQLSTDRVRAFKPDPVAYRMGLEAFRLEKHEIAFVAFGGWDAVGAKTFGYPTYWANSIGAPLKS